jgi:hypothetical protein
MDWPLVVFICDNACLVIFYCIGTSMEPHMASNYQWLEGDAGRLAYILNCGHEGRHFFPLFTGCIKKS